MMKSGVLLLTAVGIGYLSRRGQVKEDTAIGVVFAASFALAMVNRLAATIDDQT